MKSFNNKRLMISGLLCLLVIILLIFISSDIFTYSRYESQVSTQSNISTAIYLLNDEYQTITVKLPDVIPDDNGQSKYSFTVKNFRGDDHSDTNIKYRIHIRTTTNLPIKYDVFDTLDVDHATSIIASQSVDRDRDGTYFRHIYTDYETMLYSEDKTDVYTILFTFPESNDDPDHPINYREAKYSGIAELIEINIESKQIISTDA